MKGVELFNVKGRADSFTGEWPTHVVNSDFRNTHDVMGMCSISHRKSKVFMYTIGEYKNEVKCYMYLPVSFICHFNTNTHHFPPFPGEDNHDSFS